MSFKNVLKPSEFFNPNSDIGDFVFDNFINFINMIKYKSSIEHINNLKKMETVHFGIACLFKNPFNTKDINIFDIFYFKYEYSINKIIDLNRNYMIPYRFFNLFSSWSTISSAYYFDLSEYSYYLKIET